MSKGEIFFAAILVTLLMPLYVIICLVLTGALIVMNVWSMIYWLIYKKELRLGWCHKHD